MIGKIGNLSSFFGIHSNSGVCVFTWAAICLRDSKAIANCPVRAPQTRKLWARGIVTSIFCSTQFSEEKVTCQFRAESL